MGTAYMILSAGLFLLETIMQLCVVGTHSKGSEAFFVVLLAIVMGPLIFINFVSAIQVTRTQDFSGKALGRAICIGFHSVQLGIVWRSLKLLILFESKDWLDYLNMRLFHCGFQSLPFCVVLAYSMFIKESKSALDIITIIVSIASASVALTTYRTGEKLFEDEDLEDRKIRIRKHVGALFLILSTASVLIARCSSIVLFSVVEPLWIPLPLAMHFILHLVIKLCKLKRSEGKVLSKVAKAIYVSFVDIFDMVGRDYSGVKCSYVLYYSLVMVENLVFSSYWMLTASFNERFKLFSVLIILLCFIVGLIVKFASCGCIFNVESDILSEAFNNPELSSGKLKEPDKFDKVDQGNSDRILPEMQTRDIEQTSHHLEVRSRIEEPQVTRKKHSKHGSSTASSNSRLREYDNEAFVRSQGNLSLNQHMSQLNNIRHQGNSNKHHSSDSAEVSFEIRTLSLSSQEHEPVNIEMSHGSKEHLQNIAGSYRKSRGSKEELSDHRQQSHNSKEHSGSSNKQSRGKGRKTKLKQKQTNDENKDLNSNKPPLKPTIIVSDTSKNANVTQTPVPQPRTNISSSNADLASANSRYSRNTHTLNGSVQNYRYNGFEDPFREKKQYGQNKRRHDAKQHNHYHHHHHQYSSHLDYSLDSSELYPSMSSDTSSMSSYTDRNERIWRKQRQRIKTRNRHLDSRDGYSTDVSNSDYLSFNDYSMEDSSSWTESSSSSDGAATWPPSHTANLLKMYNIPDKESSTENIMHWLESMQMEESVHNQSFSTLHEPSVASDTDISLSAMQTFEIKKEKKKFKRLISKPKGFFLKFSSLNYKGKDKGSHSRNYPLKKSKDGNPDLTETTNVTVQEELSLNQRKVDKVSLPTMPLPIDSVQESIV